MVWLFNFGGRVLVYSRNSLTDRAAEDLELYFKGLREDQLIYLYPCKGMTIEKAIAITGGKRLVVTHPVENEIKLS